MVKIYGNDVLKLSYEEPLYERDISSITEQAGYVDAETQVRRMLTAGVNLMAFRKGMYEYDDGDVPEDAQPDPTLDVGFDLADASRIIENAKATAEALQKEGAEGGTSPVSGAPEPPNK